MTLIIFEMKTIRWYKKSGSVIFTCPMTRVGYLCCRWIIPRWMSQSSRIYLKGTGRNNEKNCDQTTETGESVDFAPLSWQPLTTHSTYHLGKAAGVGAGSSPSPTILNIPSTNRIPLLPEFEQLHNRKKLWLRRGHKKCLSSMYIIVFRGKHIFVHNSNKNNFFFFTKL